jgi:hypothetical protein
MPTLPKKRSRHLRVGKSDDCRIHSASVSPSRADNFATENARNDYTNQVFVQNCCLAAARIATEAKEDAFVAEIKRNLFPLRP